MDRYLRLAFFLLIVRPVVYVLLGLNIRHRERLPTQGPAIIAANHNSHLDTLVLMSLLPIRLLAKVRPVAAVDYFMRNRFLAWFATRIIGIIPVSRTTAGGNPLAGCFEALRKGDILILFPEGSRGVPERMQSFKQGIRVIGRKFPSVPVVPVFLHGLGRALPKGEIVLVPIFCDVFIGSSITYADTDQNFIPDLAAAFEALASEGRLPIWE